MYAPTGINGCEHLRKAIRRLAFKFLQGRRQKRPESVWRFPVLDRLVALDHTHCFTNSEQLDRKMDNISAVKEELIYGLFPEFKRFLRRDALLI